MQVVLVMFRADGERRSFSITRDMTVIGRREDSDFRIPLGDVSRKHCRLIKDGDALRVEDLGSSNGTYCNGTRITQCDLNPGDTLQVGPVVFVTQIDGSPADEDLEPIIATTPAGATAEADGEEITLEEAPVGPDGAAEFDPMDALTSDAEGSGFNFNIEEELGSGIAGAEAIAEGELDAEAELGAESEMDALAEGAPDGEDIIDLEESEQEHDQKA